MNAYQPKETQTYGYDNTCLSFDSTGTLIFGYDAPSNWFTTFNVEASPGTASRFRQFTGKERDQESGLDYFGARYYGSALGRFTSPDWSSQPTPVPYANLSNPQTLNLYAYVVNNPLGRPDLDGHVAPNTGGCNGKSSQDCQAALDKVVNAIVSAPHSLLVFLGMAQDTQSDAQGNVNDLNGNQISSSKADQLKANKEQGKQFAESVKGELDSKQTGVVDQLTVKTQSGVKTRLDFAGTDQSSGSVALT